MADGIMNRAQIMDTVTELRYAVDEYNQNERQWDAMLCLRTHKETERVYQRAMGYQPVGEGGTPSRQRPFYQDIDLPVPMRYGLGTDVTQMALEDGLDRESMLHNHSQAIDADRRWVTKVCTRAMLLDGGWWDGTAAPPTWEENTFTSAEDHYLGYNVSGIPTLAHFTAIKRHIQEHGFGLERDGGVICMINGDTADRITNLAEWATAPGPMPTPVMSQLQEMGLRPGFRAGGCLVAVSDMIPDYYGVAWAVNQKPLHWRMPRGLSLDAGVLTWNEGPNVRTYDSFDYIRRGSAKVTLRGAGVAVYFNSATWTDPTITLTA